jgi:hypothetical protein
VTSLQLATKDRKTDQLAASIWTGEHTDSTTEFLAFAK